MIYVNQKQLDQVEYLIEQSCRGHHVLFDAEIIRRVFAEHFFEEEEEEAEVEETIETAEKHIENLILQPTIISKRAYLENLQPDVLRRVVRTYFSIVENNIFEAQKFCQ
jgi:hypothetical protein